MNNLLEKAQIIQSIIIIAFILISNININTNEKNLDKNTDYYIFLQSVITYNKIIKKYLNNNDSNNIFYKLIKNKKDNNRILNIIPDNEYDILSKNNEYFYFFYNNNNNLTYFYKDKNSDEHIIYFGGIDNINNIKNIVAFLLNDYSFENIEKILYETGIFNIIVDNKVVKINKNTENIYDVFNFLFNNIYNIDNIILNTTPKKINLNVNGYSLGGPFSQIFVYNILKKYKDTFNIKIYNIESWFAGNKKMYNKLNNDTLIFNTYNKKSLLYFFNLLFQKYFKSDLIINVENNSSDYINEQFPKGLIKYFNENHLLSILIKDN